MTEKIRTVLCFGDSNTHGMVDKRRPSERFGPTQRWPRIMQESLGQNWIVIEEGLNGRTTDRDDPVAGEYRNGRRFLRTCLETHKPIDLLIVMLGTNDLKLCFDKNPDDVGASLGRIVQHANSCEVGRNGKPPSILIVSPPFIQPNCDEYIEAFEKGHEKSLQLPAIFAGVARLHRTEFFDANDVVDGNGPDGVHMSLEGHRSLGLSLAGVVRQLESNLGPDHPGR